MNSPVLLALADIKIQITNYHQPNSAPAVQPNLPKWNRQLQFSSVPLIYHSGDLSGDQSFDYPALQNKLNFLLNETDNSLNKEKFKEKTLVDGILGQRIWAENKTFAQMLVLWTENLLSEILHFRKQEIQKKYKQTDIWPRFFPIVREFSVGELYYLGGLVKKIFPVKEMRGKKQDWFFLEFQLKGELRLNGSNWEIRIKSDQLKKKNLSHFSQEIWQMQIECAYIFAE